MAGSRAGRLFSAPKPDLPLSRPASAAVPRRATGTFPGPAARSAPFDPAAIWISWMSDLLPRVRVVFADGAQERARTERASGDLGGRLFECTEIATMADKMLMDEAPSNAGWTSTGVLLQMEALEMFLAMYGSTDRCSSAPSP